MDHKVVHYVKVRSDLVGSKNSSAPSFLHFPIDQEFFVPTTLLPRFHEPFQSNGESLMPWKRLLRLPPRSCLIKLFRIMSKRLLQCDRKEELIPAISPPHSRSTL